VVLEVDLTNPDIYDDSGQVLVLPYGSVHLARSAFLRDNCWFQRLSLSNYGSQPLTLEGIDRAVLDVRVLSPVDLAVSKLGRFASHDRDDIAALARHKLIDSAKLRRRAEEALAGYVGDVARLRGSIEIACRIVDDERKRRKN